MTAPVRDIPPPPCIADMTRLDTHGDIAEVLRSRAFRQGSHQESRPVFDRSLIMLDGPDHVRRRTMLAGLFSREVLVHRERTVLRRAIDRAMAEVAGSRDGDGVGIGDLVPLVRRMRLEMTAAITGMDESTRRRPFDSFPVQFTAL